MTETEEIPVVWQKPHNSTNIYHTGTINILLDRFIKRYRSRLKIRNIMVDMEMPKNPKGYSDKTFVVKLHLTLVSGKIIRAESRKRSISEAMKNITREIDNQTRSTDREKHHDSSRRMGDSAA